MSEPVGYDALTAAASLTIVDIPGMLAGPLGSGNGTHAETIGEAEVTHEPLLPPPEGLAVTTLFEDEEALTEASSLTIVDLPGWPLELLLCATSKQRLAAGSQGR